MFNGSGQGIQSPRTVLVRTMMDGRDPAGKIKTRSPGIE